MSCIANQTAGRNRIRKRSGTDRACIYIPRYLSGESLLYLSQGTASYLTNEEIITPNSLDRVPRPRQTYYPYPPEPTPSTQRPNGFRPTNLPVPTTKPNPTLVSTDPPTTQTYNPDQTIPRSTTPQDPSSSSSWMMTPSSASLLASAPDNHLKEGGPSSSIGTTSRQSALPTKRTCTPRAQHMHIPCTPRALDVHPTCTHRAHTMHTTCIPCASHVHTLAPHVHILAPHVHPTCTPRAHTPCTPRALHMHTTCTPLHTTCTPVYTRAHSVDKLRPRDRSMLVTVHHRRLERHGERIPLHTTEGYCRR